MRQSVTQGQIADALLRRGELNEALRIHREEALPDYKQLTIFWSARQRSR